MSGIVYVIKSLLCGRKGTISPGQVLHSDQPFKDIDFDTSPASLKALMDNGHVVMCSKDQLINVLMNKPIKPPVKLGMDPDAIGSSGDERDDTPYENTSTEPTGWDPKYLAQKDDNELRDIAKRTLPTLVGVDSFERNKLIDILSAKHKSRVNPHA